MSATREGRLLRFFVFSSLLLFAPVLVSVAPAQEPQPDAACPSCDDLNPCTVDSCDTTTGFCRHDAVICNDANPCTADSCDPASAAGCQFAPLPVGTSCDDANPCSVGDLCTGDSQRVCAGTLVASGTPCNDGNACTVSDFCTAEGQCLGTPLSLGSDCDDQNPCTSADLCVEGPSGAGSVACVGTPRQCDDGNPCTQDACNPATGLCGAAPENCDDGNPCTQDACNPTAGGCVHTAQTGTCSDGRFCTVGESCSGGNCVGGHARDCSDGIPCTSDFCVENPGGKCQSIPDNSLCPPSTACVAMECLVALGCVGRPLTGTACTDGNPCTTEQCNNGACTETGTLSGTPCSDGNPCTAGDMCSNGTCQSGTTLNCDDGNPCTTDTCTASGGCSHAPNTLPCDDGNPCTAGDTCQSGSCAGSPYPSGGTPTLSVSLSPAILEPPRHQMVDVVATVIAQTSCGGGAAVTLVSIVSNEPDDAPGLGDGHTTNDIQQVQPGTADFTFQLRAERDGNGTGRVYRVTYQAVFPSGVTLTSTANARVPRTQARKALNSSSTGGKDAGGTKKGGPGEFGGSDTP